MQLVPCLGSTKKNSTIGELKLFKHNVCYLQVDFPFAPPHTIFAKLCGVLRISMSEKKLRYVNKKHHLNKGLLQVPHDLLPDCSLHAEVPLDVLDVVLGQGLAVVHLGQQE